MPKLPEPMGCDDKVAGVVTTNDDDPGVASSWVCTCVALAAYAAVTSFRNVIQARCSAGERLVSATTSLVMHVIILSRMSGILMPTSFSKYSLSKDGAMPSRIAMPERSCSIHVCLGTFRILDCSK